MTAVEKLFVQIFERKNLIIDLVKQQTELCKSKLFNDGIAHPSWILSPDSQELNKEEQVSKLLLPNPQPSVHSIAHYPLYSNVVVGGDDGGLSGGAFLENLAFSKVLNWQNDQAVPVISSEDHVRCAVNPVPEPDTSVTSPEDPTEERILSTFNAPYHSLAGIKRSKSRQKALELRSRAKIKSCLDHGIDSPNKIRFSLSASKQAGQADMQPKLAEPRITDGQNSKDGNLDEADCQDKEKGTDLYSGRITRSRSYANAPVSARGSLPLGCLTEDHKEHELSDVAKVREERSPSVSSSQQDDNCIIKFPKCAGQSTIGCQSCRSRLDGEDGFSKNNEADVYTCTTTRSKASSLRQSCAGDSSKCDSSSDGYPRIDTVMDIRDGLPPDCIEGSLVRVDPCNALNGGCEARESILEDCKPQGEKNAVPWSSGHLATCVDELPDLELSSHSAKADCNTASSRCRSALQISDSNEVQGLVKSPVGSYCRVTESQILSNDMEKYESVNRPENLSFRARVDTVIDNRVDLLPDCIEGSLVRVDPANALNGGCEARESSLEDFKTQGEKNALPQSSGHLATCVEELPDQDIPSHSAKADCNTASSHGRSALQISDSNEVQRLVKSPVGSYGRVSQSQIFSDDKEKYESVNRPQNLSFRATQSKSGSKQKSSANNELQNSASGQQIIPCDGTQGMLNEQGIASPFSASELVLHDHVGQSGNSSSGEAKQRVELESQAAFSPVDPCMFVAYFNKAEEGNLRTFTSNSGKGRLDNLPRKVGSSLSDVVVSLDEGDSGDSSQLCVGKKSPETSDISSKEEEVLVDSFESDVLENADTHAEKCGPVKYTMSKSSQNDPEDGQICKFVEAQQKAYMPHILHPMKYGPVLDYSLESDAQENLDTHVEKYELVVRENTTSKSSLDDPEDRQVCQNFEAQQKAYMPDILHPMKLHLENVLETLPEPCVEEVGCSGERIDKKQLMSIHQDCENLTPSNCLSSVKQPRAEINDLMIEKVNMANPIANAFDKIKQFSVQESQIVSCLEGEVSNQHADSPVGDNGSLTSGTVRSHGKSLSLVRSSSHTSQNTWPQIKRRKIEHKTHNFTTSPSFRVKKLHNSQRRPPIPYLENMEINVDSVLMDTFDINKITDVESCRKMDPNLREGSESPFLSTNKEVEFSYEKNEHTNLSSVIKNEQLGEATASSLTANAAKISLVQGIESHKCEGGSPSNYSASNMDLELSDIDQSMPVFEEFLVDVQADSGELDFTADGIDFNKLNLPSSYLEHASILAEIRRSTSLVTPLSHFSPTFKYDGTQNLFQSVPNGDIESLDLRSALPSSSGVDEQLQSGNSHADHCKNFLEPMPYSDCLAYSGARFGWSSRNQHASPVRNLWERLSSHSGSSEKHSISNPELTCFPIEEEPSSSEENKAADENADDVQKEIDSSLANSYDKRQPLQNLSNLGIGTNGIKKAKESINNSISRSNLSNKTSLKRQLSLKESSRNNIVSKVSSKESINNSINRPNSSNKTSLKRQLSLKESSKNNIVSNVSSFIPLVQQKQAEAACAGKRDVKVKALEAAEAAKRLEEKRAKERKMRKDAMKLERAKLEEKNLRHMELEKKKKEEERKKKDADVIAKKRLREEKEKKEKEKKRMRLESRQQQRGHEEKMLADKAQKEKQRPKDEKMNSKKELHNEIKKQQNGKIIKEDDVAQPRAEAKLTSTEVVMNYEESGSSGVWCEAGKAIHTVNKTPQKEDLIVQENKGKSYEISPYQTDDEDEEEDEIPTKKYIPSWASKISVALLLPSQQKTDPDTIFPPESFCNVDEVLLPRKLQQRGGAV